MVVVAAAAAAEAEAGAAAAGAVTVVVVVVVVVMMMMMMMMMMMNYFSMSKPQGPNMPGSKFHSIFVRYFSLKRLSNSEIKYKTF